MGLGLLLPIAASHSRGTTYLASVRILMPTSAIQIGGTSAADTVAAIATSRTGVAAALRQAGVSRNPDTFGASDIAVQPVGSSGILDLSVTDKDPQVAVAVANSLTTHVLEVVNRASLAQEQELITEHTTEIATTGDRIETLARQAQNAAAPEAASLNAKQSLLLQDRSAMESRLSQLQGQL